MTAASPESDRLRAELEKATSLVGAARRLLATGTMVDLAALEGRVRLICDGIAGLPPETGRSFRAVIETLIVDLDRLDLALRDAGPYADGRWSHGTEEKAGG
ncbi:hypothetical protein [Magnetospirillum molischianum]|uniref:Uncharacterized protein n=1 Tax=Magnetospirillum molischianum DSM 120 TaxID=1150626 RepID=H8FU25_MAGML|nr:hypothetical protein [Magnetospirillum molischianum]CCG41863.1 conserved hypothetical protein [Magnetospirillum molischianum DSM 120]